MRSELKENETLKNEITKLAEKDFIIASQQQKIAFLTKLNQDLVNDNNNYIVETTTLINKREETIEKQLEFISKLKNNNQIEQTTAAEEFRKLVVQIEALKNEMSGSEQKLKDKHEQELQNFESIKNEKIESLETKMRSLESEKTNLLTQLEETERKLKEETIAKNQNEEIKKKQSEQTSQESVKLVEQIEALKKEMNSSGQQLKDEHDKQITLNNEKIESLETKMRTLESEKTNLLTQLEETERKLKEETIAKNQNEETAAKLAAQIEENKKGQEPLHQQPQQNERRANSDLDESLKIAQLHRYFLLHSNNILKTKPFFSTQPNIKHKTHSKKGCTFVDSNGVQCNGHGNTNKNSKTHRSLNHCPNFKIAELLSKETKQKNKLKETKSKLGEEANQNKEDEKTAREFQKLVDQIDSLESEKKILKTSLEKTETKLKEVTTAHKNHIFSNSFIFANQGEIEQKLHDQDQQISSLNRQIQDWMQSYSILNDECLIYKTKLDDTKVRFFLSFFFFLIFSKYLYK